MNQRWDCSSSGWCYARFYILQMRTHMNIQTLDVSFQLILLPAPKVVLIDTGLWNLSGMKTGVLYAWLMKNWPPSHPPILVSDTELHTYNCTHIVAHGQVEVWCSWEHPCCLQGTTGSRRSQAGEIRAPKKCFLGRNTWMNSIYRPCIGRDWKDAWSLAWLTQ